MEFEKEALFKQLVSNSGMNLYLGAGFSAYAYNSDKESLPLGNIINERLIEMFSLDKSRNFNLSKSYDADIITNVYNVKDGQDFYEKMFLINKSPFVKHQYAIFLLRKKQFDLAWKQIDQAYTESEKKVFTIANTHAVIMFEMNIGAEANSDKELYLLKETMQKSCLNK